MTDGRSYDPFRKQADGFARDLLASAFVAINAGKAAVSTISTEPNAPAPKEKATATISRRVEPVEHVFRRTSATGDWESDLLAVKLASATTKASK